MENIYSWQTVFHYLKEKGEPSTVNKKLRDLLLTFSAYMFQMISKMTLKLNDIIIF